MIRGLPYEQSKINLVKFFLKSLDSHITELVKNTVKIFKIKVQKSDLNVEQTF